MPGLRRGFLAGYADGHAIHELLQVVRLARLPHKLFKEVIHDDHHDPLTVLPYCEIVEGGGIT